MLSTFVYTGLLLSAVAMGLNAYLSERVGRSTHADGATVEYGDLMVLAAACLFAPGTVQMFGWFAAVWWIAGAARWLRRPSAAPATLHLSHPLPTPIVRCFSHELEGRRGALGRAELSYLTPATRAFLDAFGAAGGRIGSERLKLPMSWRVLVDRDVLDEQLRMLQSSREVFRARSLLVDVLDDPDASLRCALVDAIRGHTDDEAVAVRARLWKEVGVEPDDVEGQVRALSLHEQHHARFLLQRLGEHGPAWVVGALQEVTLPWDEPVSGAIAALRARHGDVQLGRLSASEDWREGALSEARQAVERS